MEAPLSQSKKIGMPGPGITRSQGVELATLSIDVIQGSLKNDIYCECAIRRRRMWTHPVASMPRQFREHCGKRFEHPQIIAAGSIESTEHKRNDRCTGVNGSTRRSRGLDEAELCGSAKRGEFLGNLGERIAKSFEF